MGFDKTPTNWIPNWAADSTTITVPIASFPELTAAEADESTGDIRKILFALCDKLNARFQAIAAADRPGKMTINKGAALNPATGEITATYSFTFILAPASIEVAAES